MHFEILVEDQSGAKALENLVPRIIGDQHTFRIHSYKGIGRIPKGMRDNDNAADRILLDSLPRLLKGYGKTFVGYSSPNDAAVVLVCDLDNKCLKLFREELLGILNACNPRPQTRFCIAIEEGEAWFLGDLSAIKAAYPRAKDAVLKAYVNDSICGTWERLADAVHVGGAQTLAARGWQAVGAEKSAWADQIAPLMDVESNASPSFEYFRGKLRELTGSNDEIEPMEQE